MNTENTEIKLTEEAYACVTKDGSVVHYKQSSTPESGNNLFLYEIVETTNPELKETENMTYMQNGKPFISNSNSKFAEDITIVEIVDIEDQDDEDPEDYDTSAFIDIINPIHSKG